MSVIVVLAGDMSAELRREAPHGHARLEVRERGRLAALITDSGEAVGIMELLSALPGPEAQHVYLAGLLCGLRVADVGRGRFGERQTGPDRNTAGAAP